MHVWWNMREGKTNRHPNGTLKSYSQTVEKLSDTSSIQVITMDQETVESKLDETTFFLRNTVFFDCSTNSHDMEILMRVMMEC